MKNDNPLTNEKKNMGEVLKMCLPMVTMQFSELQESITEMEDVIYADPLLRKALMMLGIGKVETTRDATTKKVLERKFMLFGSENGGSRNFLWREGETPVDRKEDRTKFRGLGFQFDVTVKKCHFHVDKMESEDEAYVQDWKGTSVAVIRFVQDTRAPWCLIPDDPRPFGIMVTDKQSPDEHGNCARFLFWREQAKKYHIRISDLNMIVDKINRDYFGFLSQTYVEPKTLTREEKRFFVQSDCLQGNLANGGLLKIVKQSGVAEGSVMFGEIQVGTVSVYTRLNDINHSTFNVHLEKEAMKEMELNAVDIRSTLNQMVSLDDTPTESSGNGGRSKRFGEGKKEFQQSIGDCMPA